MPKINGRRTSSDSINAGAVTDPTTDSSIIAMLKGLLKQAQGEGSGSSPVSLSTLLSAELGDSVDVSRITKGAVTLILDGVTETSLSDEFDTRNYSGVYIHLEVTSGTWTVSSLGSDISGGTFVNQYLGQTLLKTTAVSVSRGYVLPCNANYLKIRASLLSESGEIKITITPLVITDTEIPLEEFDHFHQQFVNENYGDDMAQDASGGAGILYSIYGENVDSSAVGEWLGSSISGTWDFASTDESHGGSKSVDATAAISGSVAEFDAGLSVDLTGSDYLTGWIYLNTVPPSGLKSIYIYGWESGAIVGSQVDILDYVDTANVGSWQIFLIPLVDMDLTGETVDAVRIEQYGDPASKVATFYLDDLYFDDGQGDIFEYTLEPTANQELIIRHIGLYICASRDSTLANATVPNITCDTLLGVTLTRGIRYHVHIADLITDDDTIYNLSDFMILMNMRIVSMGGDATNTWVYLIHDLEYPLVLKHSTDDHIIVEIRDDLSSLSKLVMTAGGGIRVL